MTTILVVDSDAGTSEFLADVLKTELAAVVISAGTGMLGAAAIETGAFDLAIIDVLIPEPSGYELAKRAASKNVPALLCSGHPDALARLQRWGCPHLAKPFDVTALVHEAAAIITHAAENIRRINASLGRLRTTAAGLQAAMDESHRLMQESRALLTRRSPVQSNRSATNPALGPDTAIPPDVIGEWLFRLTHRPKGD